MKFFHPNSVMPSDGMPARLATHPRMSYTHATFDRDTYAASGKLGGA
jgi:hypothetical protein